PAPTHIACPNVVWCDLAELWVDLHRRPRRKEELAAMPWRRVFIAALLCMLFLAACSGDDSGKPPATTDTPTTAKRPEQPGAAPTKVIEVTLSFVAPHFRPDPIVLQVGEAVQFKVTSADTRHQVVIEPLGIDVAIPQKSLNEPVTTDVVTPQKVGTFRIFCRIHARLPMEGTLEVRETSRPAN
ncbi:MAG: cupredoxin domain-containing protein, partial [Candidatus Entotheonellia bacterium]